MLALVTVDTDQDVIDFNDGVTSLREAIFASNVVLGADEIVFDFGHDGPATILLQDGELEITDELTVTGDGPELLTIDAQQNSRIFNITATTGDYTLAGMTLTGGQTTGDNVDVNDNAFSGGAIRSLTTGNLTVEDCDVSYNETAGARTAGGGIFADGNVSVCSSTVSGNNAWRYGDCGGIFASGNVTVTSSTISENRAADGGGIHGENVTVTSSMISGNTGAKYGRGGGIRASGDVTVTSSTISGNSVGEFLGVYHGGFGGGIDAAGNVTLTSSTISGNSALDKGGGIYASGSVRVVFSTISANGADFSSGGGIYASGDVTVICSTISENSTYEGFGGGIRASGDVTVASGTIWGNRSNAYRLGHGGISAAGNQVTIENSIVAGNTDRTGTAPDLWASAETTVSVEYSLIGSNVGSRLTEAPLGFSDENGNLIGGPVHGTIDPLLGPLADDGGPTSTHALLPGSPTIDAGDPAAVAGVDGVSVFDQRGAPYGRVSGGRIDIGAVEMPHTLMVDTLVDESDGDFSAGDLSLREAIEQANVVPGEADVHFAPGLFDSPQVLPLTMGELEITEALSLNGPGPELLTIDAQEQSRIFNITAETGDFALAGMTLTGGQMTGDNADDTDSTFSGGAIRSLSSGTLTIKSCEVLDSVVVGELVEGGGVFAKGNVSVTSSTISGNSAIGRDNSPLKYVGGIRTHGDVTVTSSMISNNDHGGIHANGDVSVNYCTMSNNNIRGRNVEVNNSTLSDDAGISASEDALVTASEIARSEGVSASGDVTVVSSNIIENHGRSGPGLTYGGGISAGGNAVVILSTVVGNSAYAGGGIHAEGDVTVRSSSILENYAWYHCGISANGNVRVYSSTIANNYGGWPGGIQADGDIWVQSSTVSGNSSSGVGASGAATIISSTVVGNTGIGVRANGAIMVDHSIVADNGQSFGEFYGGRGPLAVEHSLISDNAGTELVEAQLGLPDENGNLIGGPVHGIIDPLLGPLADNGGPTFTHALLPGSPAIDAGDPLAAAGVEGVPEFDQRGAPYGRVNDGRIDMGAFEFQTVRLHYTPSLRSNWREPSAEMEASDLPIRAELVDAALACSLADSSVDEEDLEVDFEPMAAEQASTKSTSIAEPRRTGETTSTDVAKAVAFDARESDESWLTDALAEGGFRSIIERELTAEM